MALTDFDKLSPETKAKLIRACQEGGFRGTFMGCDFGRPGGDQTAFVWRSPSGAVTIETYRVGEPKPVDLELQPDGTYAPAKR